MNVDHEKRLKDLENEVQKLKELVLKLVEKNLTKDDVIDGGGEI